VSFIVPSFLSSVFITDYRPRSHSVDWECAPKTLSKKITEWFPVS